MSRPSVTPARATAPRLHPRLASVRDRLGLPQNADVETITAAALLAIDARNARRETAAVQEQARSAALDADPDFQKRLADARMESITTSDVYARWETGDPGESPSAKALDEATSTAAYKNWR